MNLASFRDRFEPHLRRFLSQKQHSLSEYTEDTALQAMLGEPLHLVEAGGKRIRPLLCYLGYVLAQGDDEAAIFEASVMLELFHVFALIHDDIMDRGQERHGVPCVHKSIERVLEGRIGDIPHVAVSQAMIIGDLLFAWSVDALFSSSFSAEKKIAAHRVFQTMCDEVMVGQMLDVDLTTRDHSSLSEIRQKMALKTAGYTFVRPLQLGMALGNNSTRCQEFAKVFGVSLGIAFQIQDDILDAFGSIEKTGKTPLSDLRDHQHTLLTQFMLERGTADDRALLMQVWGAESLSTNAIEAVRAAYVRSGALDHALGEVKRERECALTAIRELEASSEIKEALLTIVEKAVPEAGLIAITQQYAAGAHSSA